jgi:hypothetical protein
MFVKGKNQGSSKWKENRPSLIPLARVLPEKTVLFQRSGVGRVHKSSLYAY